MTRGGAAAPHRVCFFGTYNRRHTVTRVLRQACEAADMSIIECHRPLWEETRDKLPGYFAAPSLLRLGLRYGQRAVALAREWRAAAAPVALVGFNGQLDMVLLRCVAGRRYPIVFAPLVTVSETLVDDRRRFAHGSLGAAAAGRLDRLALRRADRIVVDTNAHRQYVIDRFGIDSARVVTWHLGADIAAFPPSPIEPRPESRCLVLFYGQFLPLHGVATILDAATRLRSDPRVRFRLIGTGPERVAGMATIVERQLNDIECVEWVPYESLAPELADCDIALGIFGTSAKAQMVIPNKVYQAACVGRAIISADSPAIREIFRDGETIRLVEPGNAVALADAIAELAADSELRRRLARNAQALMRERFAPERQGQRLAEVFADAIAGIAS